MLFNELYGSYFNVLADVLSQAVEGNLTEEKLYLAVQDKGFEESALTIPTALKEQTWPLVTEDYKTPLKHTPKMPLTELQKRWLKSLLSDPRIKLFGIEKPGLEEVKPLFDNTAFYYYDRYSDGDPYTSDDYIANFKVILAAFREKKKIELEFISNSKKKHSWLCIPYKLEYSSKDDKFRLFAFSEENSRIINVANIIYCKTDVEYTAEEYQPVAFSNRATVVFELTDERGALERALLHFSYLEKETERIDDNHYRITLHYDQDDGAWLLIQLLSFGPMLKVLSPPTVIEMIQERLNKQEKLRVQ